MNPIWDYVKKVERHLPSARRMEVAGALYASLKARKEAMEKANGRKASDAEIAGLLAGEGDPAVVAERLSGAPGQPELLSRYLAAVERHLPREGMLDVMAELREGLLAQIEAKEDALGRPATTDEIAAVLKAYGAPPVVAARYEGRMHLIGPVLYPWFWPTQRTAVGVTIAIFMVITAIRALATDRPIQAVLTRIDNMIGFGLAAFAAVTLVFIAIERWGDPVKLFEKRWDPKTLPRDHIRKPRSLFESGVALFFDILFILFWLRFVPFPNELPLRDGASVAIVMSPTWSVVYWPILALALLAAAGHLHDMVRPAWNRLRSGMSIVGYAGGLAVIWALFQGRPFVEVLPKPGTSPEELARALRLVDGVMLIGLGVTALVWAIALGFEVWRQVKASRLSGGPVAVAV
jgi:hypothetical protein